MRRHYAVTLSALFVVVLIAAVAAASCHSRGEAGQGRCFPVAHWDAAKRLRPCVRVVKVEEDGSFRFRVSDADGTVRYVSGVGALDR